MQHVNQLNALPEDAAFDLVVAGAGGAGMAAALFAAMRGARVLLVEGTGHVGGTTALSAGTSWIPGTRHGAQVNPDDSVEQAARYLDHAIHSPRGRALREVFLREGAATVEELEAHTEMKFRAYPRHPDYLSELEGSTMAGRALEPLPFDGRLLGPLFSLVRPPIPEFTVLGGMMVDRNDIGHLLNFTRSWASLRHTIKLLARHASDRLRHPRGTRLVMGNAHVGRLLYSLAQRDEVTLLLHTRLVELERDANGAVCAAVLEQEGRRQRVRAPGGVILASGGFNRHPQRRRHLLPGIDIAWCPGAPGHTGEAHEAAEAVGARYGQDTPSPAFWAPVSCRRRPDGSVAVFPHFVMDRAKPGVLAVNQAGERFVNESTSYNQFGLAMQRAGAIPAYLICDAEALRKYGLGMVRPGGRGLEPYLADGYLVRGQTLAELAQALGINGGRLARTVERFNEHARAGHDPDFHRGETAYQRNLGDPAWPGPNPSLGPLTQGPFYALRLYPGDIGASMGFVTDTHTRVLDAAGDVIPGLYAVGNDMQSLMDGVYTGPGITIGPGLVFARQAARHACGRLGRS
jgi:succinate dehydrogenase/fumarate reductase flavoprotein subunit